MTSKITFQGSTSEFYRIREGVVLKSPARVWEQSTAYHQLTETIAMNFMVERQILEALGRHPRVVGYLGWQEDNPRGLLLAEASFGSLQQYLDENDSIPLIVRKRWCRQVVESIQYIHGRGVIHSDLRPDNFLVHATSPRTMDLWLCDFGGSTCDRLGLDGGHLPDSGFYDPNGAWSSTPATDIFSIGSILYTIVTGHWPYRTSRQFQAEGMEEYAKYVDACFKDRKFPDIQGLYAGQIIHGCWTNKFSSAEEVLRALDLDDTESAQ